MKTWLKATLGLAALAGAGLMFAPVDRTQLGRAREEVRALQAEIPRLEEALRADGMGLYQARNGRDAYGGQAPQSVVRRWERVQEGDFRRLRAAQEGLADATVRVRELESRIVPEIGGGDGTRR